ncbi:Replication protein A 70 kDa DNA-binding subunit B, partial [Linum perenne]
MEKRLLANLPADSTGTTLLLRLLHVWKAGNPTTPHKFFAFSTLWVDEMAEVVAAKISPGKLYNITNFGVGSPRKTLRATESTHMLILTVTTEFEEATEEADFVLQAFGFVEFEDLSDRGPTSGFLADIICRPVRIRKPGHIATINGFALMQKIFAVNERNVELTITLWGEFCSLLNLEDIKNRDKEAAVILAFGGLFISEFAGLNSSLQCTSPLNDDYPRPHGYLCMLFGQSRGSIEIEIADFPTSASLSDHIRDSHKTVLELNGLAGDPPLHVNALESICFLSLTLLLHYLVGYNSDVTLQNPRFRCRAYIRRVNIDRPWAYRACIACHKAVTPMGNDFSCYKHDLIPAEKTRHFYKIQLEVYDDSGESTFVLLGSSADSVMPVSASDLCRSFPLDSCVLPPDIKNLEGLHLTFEVVLPQHNNAGFQSDIRVHRILDMPRQLNDAPSGSPSQLTRIPTTP